MTYDEFVLNVKKYLRIDLSGYKVTQMQRRILQLAECYNCPNLDGYLKLLINDAPARERFINHLTINVTEFFRNPDLFDFLEKNILPTLVEKSSPIKLWSAACSNGAEPYSLAIMLQDRFPRKSFTIDATDIDHAMLTAAKQGEYPKDLLKNMSQAQINKYFSVFDNNTVKVNAGIKSQVNFYKHNLLSDPYPAGYDLILCRNVTIYFVRQAQEHCYINFFHALNPGGVLFIGASENLLNYGKFGFKRLHPCFYQK